MNAADPQQEHNVIEEHPDVAAKMRAHLDAWWDSINPTVNDFGAVILGADAENPSQLSPSDWQDSFLDQGKQVRDGLRRNGVWNVVVDRAGTYEFELRRWPRETGAAISAGLPAHKHTDGKFPPGIALPIAKARVKIGSVDESCAVSGDAQDVTFKAELPAGRTKLQSWFYDADGHELCGAYYVYVKRK
jgi:hypothetical protein